MRERLKRMRYLGDDTREEEGDQEIEEDNVAGGQETTEEVTREEIDCQIRRKTGKGRRTNSVIRENEQETEDGNINIQKSVPGTFTEIVNKYRKPSWP